VKAGILNLYQVEHRRIIEEARSHERTDGIIDKPAGISWEEADLMVTSMEAVPGERRDLRHPTLSFPSLPPEALAHKSWWREWAASNLMTIVERAITELGAYDGHAQKIRDYYQNALERELKIDAQYFGSKNSNSTEALKAL
jgi:hypothetical protein